MSESIDDFLKKWVNSSCGFRMSEEEGKKFIYGSLVNNFYEKDFKIFLDGRPNNGESSLFDYYTEQFRKHVVNTSKNEGFNLEEQALEELLEENKELFERIFILSYIKKGPRIINGINAWLDSSYFIIEHANDEDITNLEIHIPFVLYAKGLSKLNIAYDKNNYNLALTGVQETIEEIEGFDGVTEQSHLLKEASLKGLKYLENMIITKKPKTKLERLHEELDGYVIEENYEKAAELRDLIKEQEKNNKNLYPES
tara:strand:- start:4850 stop:5614 length:765 start_codon:yes stop_codon:yes gene_type:complete